MLVEYSFNGKKFRDFGVYVSASEGLLDKPKPKSRKTYDWAEYHGKVVDTTAPRYDERSITLHCWTYAESWHEMKAKVDDLLSELDKQGLCRMLVEFGKELVFDVYLAEGVEIKKKFSQGRTLGEFSIKLKEPNPIKKVLKYTGTKLTLNFTAKSWVDIKINHEAITSEKGAVKITKTLPRGTHYITIAGNLEDITGLTTNAEIIF